MKKEIRNYKAELRLDPENDHVIEGYAAIFESYSNKLWDFREIIAPGAFRNAMTQEQEVLGLFNHDDNLLLSRQANESLSLRVDEKGLYYRMELPDTSLGRDIREMVKSGLISGSSFAFTVRKDEWDEQEDGTWIRTIHEVDTLYDVSPVTTPAYPATSVSARSYDKVKAILEKREAQEAQEEKEAIESSLRIYNDKLLRLRANKSYLI